MRRAIHGNTVIIGAGPAGLGCAYELMRLKATPPTSAHIFDKNDRVGGLARTYQYKKCFFDIGPHRFYTRNDEVLALWKRVLGKDFVTVSRLTRIYYRNRFIRYPIELGDVMTNLGLKESLACVASFMYARISYARKIPKTFEDWITKYFGYKLFTIFFKTYTEKIWGIPCHEIGAEWASQRIKNLNFIDVVKNAVLPHKQSAPKSLIGSFSYPKRGAGAMYEKIAQQLVTHGADLHLNSPVVAIHHTHHAITSIEYRDDNELRSCPVGYLFSSMPLTQFILSLDPKPHPNILRAANKLYYRDHITVNLLIKGSVSFPDNWIYIHDPAVAMARVTNYNSFTQNAVKLPPFTALSVEYFAFKDDALWRLTDAELIDVAKNELNKTELVPSRSIVHGFVIRELDSYPAYYIGHTKYYTTLKHFVSRFRNLSCIGRGGMYKYNNMDHAIYSGMLAARNYAAGKKLYDVWNINVDAEYLEQK